MGIEELKRERQRNSQPIKSQKKNALWILVITLILYVLFLKDFNYSYVLFIGVALGYILQRSKFCFGASIRDVILFRKTKLLRAIFIGMVISTIGFGIIQYNNLIENGNILGQIAPVGLHTVVGGILFGIGMSIAGGCISTGFIRIGEGYLLPWITLIGIAIGTSGMILTYKSWGSWVTSSSTTIYLGDYLSMKWLIPVQSIVLIGLIYIMYRFEKNNKK